MRVTLHDYSTDPLLPQKDGVNLAHENIAALLRDNACTDLAVAFHDINRLLADDAHAREVLAAADCVISNIGPHAHYYFYLRERFNLQFNIIRDVRTAIWSSYLFQEHLVAPYLRAGDMLMVASHYTRGVYEKIFPHLQQYSTFRCYPLTVAFPTELPPRQHMADRGDDTFVLGYIGRLSEDKNFPDLVQLLITLNKEHSRKYKLVACGDIHSQSCHPERIQERINQELGAGDYFQYLPPQSNGQIWELYRQFDAMVFASTSNLETLGRVLVEASYAGVPVICGRHAAAPELVPASGLCSVDYLTDTAFSSHFDHSLGRVNIEDMVRAVANPDLQLPDCHLDYLRHPDKFVKTLMWNANHPMPQNETYVLAPEQAEFIARLAVVMPQALNLSHAHDLIAKLTPWFVNLQLQDSPERAALLAQLAEISRYPERTQAFIAKSAATGGDFTNVGGIDIELCHVAGFYPEFSLASSAQSGLG